MIQKLTFSKKEHLCGEIRISKLYADGKAFIVYPIRVVYKITTEKSKTPATVLVSVPKKRFKHAVDRNRLKRLMREAYRLNKTEFTLLVEEKNIHIQIAFNYVADKMVDFDTMNSKIQVALKKISDKFEAL